MKRHIFIPFIVSLSGVFFASSLQAQEIKSNAEYKARMDSLNNAYSVLIEEWNASIPPHFRKAMKLEKEAEANPELKDSLLALAAEERKIGEAFMPTLQARMGSNQEERQALLDRYALVFEDAFPYFIMRNQFSKDSLSVLLKKSSSEIRHSAAGKALRKYIKTRQMTEGNVSGHSRAMMSKGNASIGI